MNAMFQNLTILSFYFQKFYIFGIMYNYHTHTTFCDGLDMPELYVTEALTRKMKVLGFSAHASVPFDNPWSLKNEQAYFNEIERLKIHYSEKICLLSALEVDYIPGISTPFDTLRKKWQLDYVIGAVHLVKKNDRLWFIDGPEDNFLNGVKDIFDNDIKKAVTAYYTQINEMLQRESPDIIAHLDKIKMHNKNRFFKESEKWYEALIDETLDIIAHQKTIVEVNTRGVYTGKCKAFFPDRMMLQKCLDRNIPVMVNSDAHKPCDLLEYYHEAIDMLKSLGYKELAILTKKGSRMIPVAKYY